MQQKQNRGTRRQSLNLIPAIIDGKKVSIDRNSVPRTDWTTHHGKTAAGVQVNSAATQQIGQTLFIKPEANEGLFFGISVDNAEVMFADILRTKGYTVTASKA